MAIPTDGCLGFMPLTLHVFPCFTVHYKLPHSTLTHAFILGDVTVILDMLCSMEGKVVQGQAGATT
jgi:hypothetical protein